MTQIFCFSNIKCGFEESKRLLAFKAKENKYLISPLCFIPQTYLVRNIHFAYLIIDITYFSGLNEKIIFLLLRNLMYMFTFNLKLHFTQSLLSQRHFPFLNKNLGFNIICFLIYCLICHFKFLLFIRLFCLSYDES